MHRHLTPVRTLDELTDEQRRFLGSVAAKIPKLIEAIEAGGSSARYKLGTKRLEDGRRVELELVARVPERKWDGIAQTLGANADAVAGGRRNVKGLFQGVPPKEWVVCQPNTLNRVGRESSFSGTG